MPRGRGYRKKQPPRRRLGSVSSSMNPYRQKTRVQLLFDEALAKRNHPVVKAALSELKAATIETIKSIPSAKNRKSKAKSGGYKSNLSQLRGGHDRHEKLEPSGKAKPNPVNKNKGFSSTPTGVINARGSHKTIPGWKKKRHRQYKSMAWQTILVSRPNRLAGSNNLLETSRYPVKAPETRDSEAVQAMIFSPWCSNYSGIHTSHARCINAAGTDIQVIEHPDGRFDTIQNLAGTERHDMPASLNAANYGAIVYEGSGVSAGTARAAGNRAELHAHYDQMVKSTTIDLSFMASRAFPMKISVSLVRIVDPVEPGGVMTTDDKKELLNNLDGSGCDYRRYKTHYNHQFTLPGLKVGKKPPRYSVKKTIKSDWMQSNTWQQDSVAEALTQSGNNNKLGQNIAVRNREVADGAVSGQYFILIKYRVIRKPRQFTYTNTIDTDQGNGGTTNSLARIVMPVITEESYDVPVHTGLGAVGEDGSPFSTNQGNESKGTFYVAGKIVTGWAFKENTNPFPSVMHSTPANADFRKSASLNISPWFFDNDTDGIYTLSANHVKIAASTASGSGNEV
jgi:hypothetical protein